MPRRPLKFYKLSIVKVLIVCVLATFVFVIIESNLRETIFAVANAKATQIATETINQAVAANVADRINYRELIYTIQDSNGRLVLMQANTLKLNRIAADTTLEVQQKLLELSNQRFNVPLGAAFGSKLLASYGPLIRVTIVPVGTVQVKVMDDFEEAGINQTKHRLYLKVKTRVKIVIPLTSSEAEVETLIPITETIIIGEVPQTYIKLNAEKAVK